MVAGSIRASAIDIAGGKLYLRLWLSGCLDYEVVVVDNAVGGVRYVKW